MLSTEELFSRTQCHCCQQDIPGIGIECVDCANSVKLCAECFGLGAEVGQHKSDHKYRFFDSSGNIFLFPNGTKWTAKENIRLLDGIEQFGFGNWQDISKHIESKTPAESKEEYVRRFVDGSTGKATWPHCKIIERPTVDHTCPEDGPLSPSLTAKLSPIRLANDEGSQLGYMSLRDDYEKEYDNEAEKLVSQLVFNADDEAEDISFKLALVDMYVLRIHERARRKRVIRDYQLPSSFFKKPSTTKTKRRFLPYERDVIEKLKPYAQFHSARDQEHFIQNLIKERELQFRLQELYKYRRNGIKKLDDCIDFDRGGRTETNSIAKQNGNKSNSVPHIPPPPPPKELGRSHSNAEHLLRQDQLTASDQGGNGNDCTYQDKKPTLQLSSYVAANSSSMESKSEEPCSRIIDQEDVQIANLSKHQGEQKAMDDQFTANILNLNSSHLLSMKEQNLCINNNLQPTQYLTIKTALLLNQSSEKPSTITDSEWQEVTNFMITSGWNIASCMSS